MWLWLDSLVDWLIVCIDKVRHENVICAIYLEHSTYIDSKRDEIGRYGLARWYGCVGMCMDM